MPEKKVVSWESRPPVAGAQFQPEIDGYLVVDFNGEVMRCQVARILDDDRVIVEIIGQPMAPRTMFRKGDMVGVRRRQEYGHTIWEAQSDRDFVANRSLKELVEPEPEVESEPEPKRRTRKKVA